MPCREHNYLLSVTTVITISFSCWAAFDLYAASHFRNRWSTMGAVRFAIVGTVIFWTIAYLPMIFFSDVVDNAYVFTADSYRKLNNYFSTPLVHTIGALTLIIIFTHTIENLRSQLILLGISGIPFGLQDICIDLSIVKYRKMIFDKLLNICLSKLKTYSHYKSQYLLKRNSSPTTNRQVRSLSLYYISRMYSSTFTYLMSFQTSTGIKIFQHWAIATPLATPLHP
jgi:hypothetical protein